MYAGEGRTLQVVDDPPEEDDGLDVESQRSSREARLLQEGRRANTERGVRSSGSRRELSADVDWKMATTSGGFCGSQTKRTHARRWMWTSLNSSSLVHVRLEGERDAPVDAEACLSIENAAHHVAARSLCSSSDVALGSSECVMTLGVLRIFLCQSACVGPLAPVTKSH